MESSSGSARISPSERLKSLKAIDALFSSGQTLKSYPFMLVYSITTGEQKPLVQAGFSVSKKRFRRAVDRNRVKRLLREAFRLNKSKAYDVLNGQAQTLQIMFLYIGDQLPDQSQCMTKISGLLERLKEDQSIKNG